MFFKLLYLHFYVIDGVVLIDPDFVKDGKKGLSGIFLVNFFL